MVVTTYSRILKKIAAPAIAGANICLSEEVVCIESHSQPGNGTSKVKITTAGSHREIFDHIVVTAPHGWLKQNRGVFVLPIPQELSEAIDTISYSCLEKVFIHFSTAWWEGNRDGLGAPDRFASATLWTSPEYAPNTNPGHWTQEIFSFSALPDGIAHPTLQFYIYGENSEAVTEAIQGLHPDSIAYQETLIRFFEPYYALPPNYKKSDDCCKPKGCLTTDWLHDKLAGNGSYSHFTLGADNGAKAVNILRKGMGKERNIWFAGEHTAPDIALGTIVGAYWSGERVARSIREIYGTRATEGE
jgi:monoamine oxidase